MFLLESILITGLTMAVPAAPTNGYIGGVVARANDGNPVAGAEVILFVGRAGEFVPAAKAVADENGKFIFGDLLVTPELVYKAGANWGGIHYPGPVIRLTPAQTTVGVKLPVNEPLSEPNLLFAHRHEITLRPRPGAIDVSEAIVVENPTLFCYVGKAAEVGGQPVTLRLNIPPSFEKVTFEEEFFGRRFVVSKDRLVTGLPWTPGQKELRFTYTQRNDQPHLTWTRSLDLPCADVTVRIVTDNPGNVSCSLQGERTEEPGAVVYRHTGKELAATHKITVQMGLLSVSRLAYAKWVAACLLSVLVVLAIRSRRKKQPHDDPPAPSFKARSATKPAAAPKATA